MASIFDRRRLTSRQMRSVADRRFDDAVCLCDSGLNARANGVFYLGGFVIECLLKARLLDQYKWIANAVAVDKLSPAERRIWNLIYRSHDLDEMLAHLPGIDSRLGSADRNDGRDRLRKLRLICSEWTIFARYSPLSSTMREASEFLNDVRELKEWLKL